MLVWVWKVKRINFIFRTITVNLPPFSLNGRYKASENKQMPTRRFSSDYFSIYGLHLSCPGHCIRIYCVIICYCNYQVAAALTFMEQCQIIWIRSKFQNNQGTHIYVEANKTIKRMLICIETHINNRTNSITRTTIATELIWLQKNGRTEDFLCTRQETNNVFTHLLHSLDRHRQYH